MELYAAPMSRRQARALYALAQKQHQLTDKENPTDSEQKLNDDAFDIGFAVYLAQRPQLAQLVALINAASATREAALAEAKSLGADEDEQQALEGIFIDLSSLTINDLGGVMLERMRKDMKAAAQEDAP